MSQFADVVDQVEDSFVDVFLSLQSPVLVLLDPVARVVLREERVRVLHMPGEGPLYQTPGQGPQCNVNVK